MSFRYGFGAKLPFRLGGSSSRSQSNKLAHICRSGYLIDYRESDIKLSFVELYNRPRIYEELGMPHRARIALVFKDDYPETDFIELVTENRGYRVKTFRSPELAVSWLTNKPHESLPRVKVLEGDWRVP